MLGDLILSYHWTDIFKPRIRDGKEIGEEDIFGEIGIFEKKMQRSDWPKEWYTIKNLRFSIAGNAGN